MPVRKFRTIEEMNQPVWRTPGDPALYAAIANLWHRSALLSGRRFTPGVRRFRDIASLEASADQASDSPVRP